MSVLVSKADVTISTPHISTDSQLGLSTTHHTIIILMIDNRYLICRYSLSTAGATITIYHYDEFV